MAGDIHFRPIEAGDIDYIASNLCEGERMTILDALGPVDAKDIVAKSVLMSERCEVAARDTDRKPLCVIGVIRTSLLESEGYVWMMATPEAFRSSRALVREGRRYVKRLMPAFDSFFAHHTRAWGSRPGLLENRPVAVTICNNFPESDTRVSATI